jgi:hypothetical protein
MLNFLLQHQFWIAVGLYWIFSAAVSALPEPEPKGSPLYLWLYRFLHTTAGNIATAFGGRIPGLKNLAPVLLVPLVLSTTACAHYMIHPGALNAVDSAAYDTLLVAETAIDQARTDYQSQQLPPKAKDALNTLIQAYTVSRDAWLTYRGAVAAKVPADAYFQDLNRNLAALVTAIRALETTRANTEKEVEP